MKTTRLDFDTIDSTNLEARRLWEKPETRAASADALREGTRCVWLIVAKEQKAGRGRLGRRWISPRGGLWFTLLWPFAVERQRLEGASLAVGLALAQAIESATGVDCRVKWPNDLLVKDRKLAGILCELEAKAGASALIIGVGVNANFAGAEIGRHGGYGAATLSEELGHEVDLEALLEEALDRLTQRLIEFESGGLIAMKDSLLDYLAWRGCEVTLQGSEAGDIAGTLLGVDDTGRVTIRCGGEIRTFLTGDLRRHDCA
jgi:BirA family biotin operon repressor/biotin-[acetyl-CoA-carboxylase] ligase